MALRSPIAVRALDEQVDATPFGPQRSFDPPRFPLSKSHAANMRPLQAESTRNTSEYPGTQLAPQNFSIKDSFRHVICGEPHCGVNDSSCTTLVVNQSRGNLQDFPQSGEPDITERVKTLRLRLGLNQREFGERLGITQSAVDTIEKGKRKPSSFVLLQMGNLAGEPECWHFWIGAGLDIDIVDRALSKKKAGLDTGIKPTSGISGATVLMLPSDQNVAIPILKTPFAALTPRIRDEQQVSDYIAVPRSWCIHPENVSCIRVEDNTMSPIIDPGSLVAIDSFEKDPLLLDGKMVAALKGSGSASVMWLEVKDGSPVLFPHYVGTANRPVFLKNERDWRIVGEVVWWVGMIRAEK